MRVINDDWVQQASAGDLQSLAACLLEGRIASPWFTSLAAEMAGFAGASEFLKSVRGVDPKVVAWALRSIARERLKAARSG
jgi:hypothetical protein